MGVRSVGLMIILFPAANPGATLTTTWFMGRLKGTMALTKPTGNRMARMILSAPAESTSLGSCSPMMRLASSAATLIRLTPRPTSLVESLMDMPDSSEMP